MGRAGGVSVGLIEHIIAKSSVAQHHGVAHTQVPPGVEETPSSLRVDWEAPKS